MTFPVGMSLITVNVELDDPTSDAEQFSLRVEYERVFGYVGTPWISTRFSNWKRSKAGIASLQVPHSNQAGLLGDFGAAITNLGVRFEVRPVRESVIQTLKWVQLPVSLGPTVNLSALANLGGWPNQTVVVNPPGGGGGGDEYEAVTILGATYWRKVA